MLGLHGRGQHVNSNHPLVNFSSALPREGAGADAVDGFRLDLASVHARGEDGEPLGIRLRCGASSRARARRRAIAEPWDAAGLYRLSSFRHRWASGTAATRFGRFLWKEAVGGGDADRGRQRPIPLAGKTPQNGINFVTCHDGFTL
jgi:glycogen operon protein